MTQDKYETKIGKTISDWFEEFEKASGNSCVQTKPENIVFLIGSSLPTLSKYIISAMMILNGGHRLPAKALLRVSGELLSRVLWVLNGKDKHEQQNRYKRWVITSYRKANTYDSDIVTLYEKDQRTEAQTKVRGLQKAIEERKVEIAAFKNCGLKGLPRAQDILEDVFGKSKTAVGMYAQYHHAIHPDLIVLTNSVSENGTAKGDTEESIDRLRLDCLTQTYAYFKGLCKYYGSDFKGMADKYREQYEELCAGYVNSKKQKE